jgi:hypothetical protein
VLAVHLVFFCIFDSGGFARHEWGALTGEMGTNAPHLRHPN